MLSKRFHWNASLLAAAALAPLRRGRCCTIQHPPTEGKRWIALDLPEVETIDMLIKVGSLAPLPAMNKAFGFALGSAIQRRSFFGSRPTSAAIRDNNRS